MGAGAVGSARLESRPSRDPGPVALLQLGRLRPQKRPRDAVVVHQFRALVDRHHGAHDRTFWNTSLGTNGGPVGTGRVGSAGIVDAALLSSGPGQDRPSPASPSDEHPANMPSSMTATRPPRHRAVPAIMMGRTSSHVGSRESGGDMAHREHLPGSRYGRSSLTGPTRSNARCPRKGR